MFFGHNRNTDSEGKNSFFFFKYLSRDTIMAFDSERPRKKCLKRKNKAAIIRWNAVSYRYLRALSIFFHELFTLFSATIQISRRTHSAKTDVCGRSITFSTTRSSSELFSSPAERSSQYNIECTIASPIARPSATLTIRFPIISLQPSLRPRLRRRQWLRHGWGRRGPLLESIRNPLR